MATATSGGLTTSYVYSGLGERVKKSNAGMTRYFAYDESGQLLGEYDDTGNLIQETVWFGDVPVATLRPDGTGGIDIYYVHTDHLNTPRRVTRPVDDTIVWRWDSVPFGGTSADEDPDGDTQTFTYNLRFPGQYYDQETGLHYNYFRTYDPSTGRYLESDPIGLVAGLNTYSYVSNMPTMRTDKYGLYEGDGTAPYFGEGWDGTYHPNYDGWQRDGAGSFSGSFGFGGSWHGGPGGIHADSGFAFGSGGAFCIYSRRCGSFGMGAFATLGMTASGAIGRLCSGRYKSFGVSGGGGAAGTGGSSFEYSDGVGGLTGARGMYGIGVGGYGGVIECSYTLICFNESDDCEGCQQN